MKVEDIKIKKITYNVSHKMLPKLLHERVSFKLKDINSSIANALRRTISLELEVKYLYAEDVKTNDPYIIPEQIISRLAMIPIKQTVHDDAKFSLDVINGEKHHKYINTSSIKYNDKHSETLFNDMPLLVLQPTRYIKIKDIKIKKSFGFEPGHGMNVLAVHCLSIVDPDAPEQPVNNYEPNKKNILSSSNSNPKDWLISFKTNGTMKGKDIVKMACDNIINRLQSVKELYHNIISTNSNGACTYLLRIEGESHTLGCLFMKYICENYPVVYCVYQSIPTERSCILKIKYHDDIKDLLNDTIEKLSKIFQEIKKAF